MRKNNHSFVLAGLVLALLFAFACGDTGTPTPPAPTAGFAQGPITQFGSILVNGVQCDTDSAEVVGGTLDDSNRPLGQVVVVEGEFDANGTTGTATTVVFKSELKGPVSQVDDTLLDGVLVRRDLTVLESTVIVEDGSTAFGPGYSLDAIMVNDVVEVSGLVDANGDIRATRIELEGTTDGTTPVQVEFRGASTGFTDLEPPADPAFSAGFLTVGSLSVFFDTQTVFEPADFAPWNHASVFVEVKGTIDPAFPLNVTATEIKEEDDFGEDADKISVEGFVSGYVDDSEFMVGAQAVNASDATFIPAGLQLEDGMEVEVEGPLVSGTLEATEVKFEGEEAEVAATIEEGALGEDTLTLLGSIVIHFDGGARWEDKEDDADDDAQFGFSDLQVGDFVEVRLVEVPADDPEAGNKLVATRIEREDPDDIEVEGMLGQFCADPTATESIPDPEADPEADPVPTIEVPVAPCEEGDTEAWVEVLGLRVEVRQTTELEVDDMAFAGTIAEFINQVGPHFLELEITPPAQSAPYVALEAEVETED